MKKIIEKVIPANSLPEGFVSSIHPVSHPVSLEVGYPKTDEELEAMFRLRTKVYTELGYITAESDIDEYDLNKCIYFIAKINDRLVGTVRLVIDDPLPTELDIAFKEPEEIARIPRNKRGEISRLVSIAKGMNHLVSLSLIKAIIKWAQENDFLGGYASIFKGAFNPAFSILAHPISSTTLKYDKDLLHNYFYKGDKVLTIYYLRDEAAEFMEKMKF